MTRVHLTSRTHERLRDELEERTTTRRREISALIERAREHGDIMENADYDAAKDEQAHNEARIRHLEQMMREAVVVEGATGDVVEPGAVVEIRMDDDEEIQTYLVGSIEERHERYDVISTASPLGQALLGAEPGDERVYEGPRREIRVQVVSVRSLN